MNIFSIENPFWQGVNKILQCIQVSVLWLIFSLPIVTIGASTAALYATVFRFIRNGKGYLWQTFWDAFKENLKTCTKLWGVAALLLAALGTDVWIFRGLELAGNTFGKLYWVMLVVTCLAVTWVTYLFCYAARFEGSVKEILSTSFLLFVLHPLKAVMIFLFVAGGILLTLAFPVVILLAPAGVYWISSLVLEDVFHLHMRREDLEKEEKERQESGF